MDTLAHWVAVAADVVYGPVTLALIIGTGLYLTIGLRFLTITSIPKMFRLMFNPAVRGATKEGQITPLGGLMTALAAMVGVGNIAGVATAIYLGGPGALFWMWVSALMGMGTRYAEVFLALKYREVSPNGVYLGGPMYYIKNGLGKKWMWLGGCYAAFACLQSLGLSAQSNTIAHALNTGFDIPVWVTFFFLIVTIYSVLIGGVSRIAIVATRVVPLMVLLYMSAAFIAMGYYIEEIPGAFMLIVKSAFTGTAATGGFVGAAVAAAIRYGVSRGIFSNEAGLGTAAMAHAAVRNDDTVRQAALSTIGVFIDTIIVCSITGLLVVASGAWQSGETGAPMVALAFEQVLPGVGGTIVTISVLLFGLSTMWGWGLYGEQAATYLFGEKAIMPSRYIYSLVAPMGALLALETAWSVVDVILGLMAIPNLIAILLLSPVVFRQTRERLAGGQSLLSTAAKD